MTAIISLFNSKLITKLFSNLVKFLLILRGVKVGKNFTARALPILVKDKKSIILIGNNVILKDRIELRSLKGSKLELNNGVKLDKDVRIVATNGSSVLFQENADIGCNSIFNCGANLYVGQNVLMAGFCYIQTSAHKIAKSEIIQSQGYEHSEIYIGDDCWLGGGSFIMPGTSLGKGAVVGANSLVNKDIDDFSVVAGSPAKKISERE